MSLREQFYSPLCDSDYQAYCRYLDTVDCYGSSFEQFSGSKWTAGVTRRNCCSHNAGVRVGGAVHDKFASARTCEIGERCGAAIAFCQFGFEHSGFEVEDGNCKAVGWISSDSLSDCCSGVHDVVGVGSATGSKLDSKDRRRPLLEVSNGVGEWRSDVVEGKLGRSGSGGGYGRGAAAVTFGDVVVSEEGKGQIQSCDADSSAVCNRGDRNGSVGATCKLVDNSAEGSSIADRVDLAAGSVCSAGCDGDSATPLDKRGKNWERNRKWREEKREKKAKRKERWLASRGGVRNVVVDKFADLPEEERRGLRTTFAERLRLENELKIVQSKRRIELEKAKDLTQLKKRQETQIMRQTELNKVQVEKAFAQLSKAGSGSANSSFVGVGSGSISPNSSVSLTEIYALQASDLSKTHEIGELRARLDKLKMVKPQVYKELGFEREIPPTVGSGVTVDEHGNPIIGGFEDDSSLVFGYDGYIGEDGRFHFGENPAIYDA